MNLQDGRVQVEPGERVIVVEDHGFVPGIFAAIVYRQHRFKVYQHPTESSVRRIRRLFIRSGDFARLRGSGPAGPNGAGPFPREYWVHPGPWDMRGMVHISKGEVRA